MRKTVLATGLATAAAAVVGSLANRPARQVWYTAIRRPRYLPPGAVFPIAWTALYTDIAATSASVIDRFRAGGADDKARAYATALAANLVLNAAWSWVFFGWHRLGPAALAAGALAASSADLTRRAAEADPKLGAALAPYPLWCTFAAVLSTDIWRLNR